MCHELDVVNLCSATVAHPGLNNSLYLLTVDTIPHPEVTSCMKLLEYLPSFLENSRLHQWIS